ncbi:Undecaprenyl pyrophosphate synthetase family protein [Trifolium repens]|nr:Undecaprenyl pyrophosphate synthetase family protein [Trifolium repens]
MSAVYLVSGKTLRWIRRQQEGGSRVATVYLTTFRFISDPTSFVTEHSNAEKFRRYNKPIVWRYAMKRNLGDGGGHKAGFSALLSILRYCYELGIKYVSVYAFSIDNFRRKPKEVQSVMDLMREKIEELLQQESIINEYGIRIHFIGNMQLLTEPVRVAAEKAMRVTAKNQERVLLICVAYTSTDEILHAVQESCKDKWNEIQAFKEGKFHNGGLKKNGLDLHFRDLCRDNATEACNSLHDGVE